MIRNTDLKKHIFEIPGLVPLEKVASIIGAIEQSFRNIKDRSTLKADLVSTKTKIPLSIELPRHVEIESISEIEGDIPAKFVQKTDSSFFERCCQDLSKGSVVRFMVGMKHNPSGVDLEGIIQFDNGRAWLGFSNIARWDDLSKEEQWLRDIIELMKLPIALEKKGSGYAVLHAEGGEIQTFTLFQGHPLPTHVLCDFPQRTAADTINRFKGILDLPELKSGKGTWDIKGYKKTGQDPQALIENFNELRFPSKTVELTYWWNLKSYKAFAEMVDMAKIANEKVDQHLLEFEFGSGKKCQLDGVTDKQGRFKLFFSFDNKEDAPELAQALKIKLRPND